MRHFITRAALLISCAIFAPLISAQTVLIKNAKIISGNTNNQHQQTDILIENGRISNIASGLTAGDSATIIDASGKTVSAGFFNAETQLGVTEVGAVKSTRDYSTENARITASLRVADAYNSNSTLIPHNRMLGVTHALVQPQSDQGLFAGVAALIDLSGGDTVIDESAAMVVTLGANGSELAGGSRAAAMALLREAIEDARDYAANRDSVNRGSRRDYTLSRHDLEALSPVIKGKMPLLAHVNRASDIRHLLRFAKKQKLKLILSGAAEAWMVAEQIAKQNVPVILDPIANLPASYESIGSRLDNAKLLDQAGVTLLFTGMGWQNTHNAFLVRQSAGNAVSNGLPYDVAIKALTINPGKVFKLKGYGDIKVGSDASLVIWSGDPLELSSSVERVLINGVDFALHSRATRLRDRYWNKYKRAN